jgi:hypothetical protein
MNLARSGQNAEMISKVVELNLQTIQSVLEEAMRPANSNDATPQSADLNLIAILLEDGLCPSEVAGLAEVAIEVVERLQAEIRMRKAEEFRSTAGAPPSIANLKPDPSALQASPVELQAHQASFLIPQQAHQVPQSAPKSQVALEVPVAAPAAQMKSHKVDDEMSIVLNPEVDDEVMSRVLSLGLAGLDADEIAFNLSLEVTTVSRLLESLDHSSSSEPDDVELKRIEITYPNGNHYIGTVKKSLKKHGKGVLNLRDGHKYEGEFKDDLFSGQGIYTAADLWVYEGQFRKGKFCGQGIYTSADHWVYEGQFRKGKFCGYGVKRSEQPGYLLSGEWMDGKLNGKGSLINDKGASYEGDYKDGSFEGSGVLIRPNGDRYEGCFKEGKENGEGTCYQADGSKIQGVWVDGKISGKHNYTTPEGASAQIEVVNGEIVSIHYQQAK